MKAVAYRRYGGPEVLENTELPTPVVGPDSVLVKVVAAAVNPVDWKAREGYLAGILDATFPVVPGWDMAGVVVRGGLDTPEYREGDEVIGYVRKDVLSGGTCAEYVVAPVRTLAPKPAALDFGPAAGIPLAGLTAYQSLAYLGIERGDTVLIHAAAGGVGLFGVQIARHFGARVIGTASPRNHEMLAGFGAEPVAYGDGLADRLTAAAPDGVDAVLDCVGGDAVSVSVPLLTKPGRLVSIVDRAAGEIGGRAIWARPVAADLAALSELADAGALRVEVARTYPLDRVADAHRASAEGHTRGKLIIAVS